jgi:hypothetical protein
MIFQKNFSLKIGIQIITYLVIFPIFFGRALADDTNLTLSDMTRNPFAPTEQILSGMASSYTDNSRPTFVSSGALTRLPPLKLR